MSERNLFNSTGCDTFKDLIQQDLDGVLNALDQADLKLHLDVCETCEDYRNKIAKLELNLAHIATDGPQASATDLNLLAGIMPDLERIAATRAENARRRKGAEDGQAKGWLARLGQQTWFRRYGMAIAAALVLMVPAGTMISNNLSGNSTEVDLFAARFGSKDVAPTNPPTEATIGLNEKSQQERGDNQDNEVGNPAERGGDYTVRETGNELAVFSAGYEVFRTSTWLDGVRADYKLLADDVLVYSLYSAEGELLASYQVDLVTGTMEQVNEADTDTELR